MRRDPETLLKGLNPPQREVVLHHLGAILAAAVAGAGKTTVLVRRIAYLLWAYSVHPGRILAVTFSRKGADEMNERLAKLAGDTQARVGTFHSLALEIVKTERPELESWTIDDRNKFRFCIKDAVDYKGMKWRDADITYLESFIGKAKNDLLRPESEGALQLAQSMHLLKGKPYSNPWKVIEAYQRSEELRRDRMLLTFDDMLLDAAEMLRDNEHVRARWASRWDFVMQDEAQDQNLGQLLMGELLAKDHGNYMLVGDPAQTIFTWRGAHPEKLLAFEKKWNAKVVRMDRNYRCGQIIIDAANKTLDSMDPETKLEMQMQCCRTVEGTVTSKVYMDLDDEAQSVAEHIQQLVEDGKRYGDIVLLYRTNAQSRAPEEAMISARIPYRIIGSANFYERREVKNLLAYLRLSAGRGDFDDVNRCINSPFRFLGKRFVERVKDEAEVQHRSGVKRIDWVRAVSSAASQAGIQSRQKRSAVDWADLIDEIHQSIEDGREYLKNQAVVTGGGNENPYLDSAKPARILEDIVRITNYTQWLRRDEGEESTENSRVSNVRELVRAAERFPTVDELLDYIDKNVAESKKQRRGKKQPNKVTLMTIHRSKGMEFPVVFLIGCADGILPHARTESYEEERRLFYVGVTRARDELHVSTPAQMAIGNKVREVPPSGFVRQAGLTAVPAGRLAQAQRAGSGLGIFTPKGGDGFGPN